MKSRRLFLEALALLTLSLALPAALAENESQAPGLDPDVPFRDYLQREYTTEDGLPSNWIHALLQSREGYVWIGTHNGLARFDGRRFTTFNARNTPEMPGNNTRALFESREGSVWIGTTRGLVRYRPGRPGAFEEIRDLAGVNVSAIYEDHAGVLWVGTKLGLRSSEDGTSFSAVEGSPPMVLDLEEDAAGTLWVGTLEGLYRSAEDRFVRAAEEQLPALRNPDRSEPRSGVRALLSDGERLWIGAHTGLLRGEQGRYEFQEQGIDRWRIMDLLRTRGGSIFAGGRLGLYRSAGGAFEKLPVRENIECLMEDREGGLWVGFGADGGLHRYQNGRFRAILTDHRVHCVQEDSTGGVWFGTGAGLFRLVGDTLTEFGEDEGLPGASVKAISRGPGESLLISTSGGLVRWDGSELSAPPGPSELLPMRFRAIYEDRSGVLWLARHGEGSFALEDGRLRSLEGSALDQARWFQEDATGQLWAGTDAGLYRRVGDRFERAEDPALDRVQSNLFCCYADPNGDLWVGTGNGIFRHRGGSFDTVTVRDGLGAGYIERMHADGSGNLWFGGRHGFFYIPLQELNDFLAGRRPRVESRWIDHDFGMSSLAGGTSWPRSCLASDGTLWMTAGNGVLRIPPELPPGNPVPPPVIIERVRVDGRTVEASGPVELVSGARRLMIDFATPTFVSPELVRARYRLDGHDEEWIDAAGERVVHYTDLHPGDYTFRVIAENGAGVWSEESASVSFVVKPRWWEMTGPRLAILAVLLAGAAIFVHLQMLSIRRRNAELQHEIDERQRAEETSRRHWEQLARVSRAASMGELTTSIAHEVKQPLFAIVSNAQTANRLLAREEPDYAEIREALEDIASDGNRASGIIDHVRSLVHKADTPAEVVDLNAVVRDVLRLVDPAMRRRGISIRTDLTEGLPGVTGTPIELQQVLINLVINGAQAMSEIEIGVPDLLVRTSVDDGSVTVAVEDRGVGIDEQHSRQLFEPFFTTKQEGTGMGLAINRTIIEQHRGKIRASSNRGPGATFEFSLPIRKEGDS